MARVIAWTVRAWVVAGAGLLVATSGLRSLLVTGSLTSAGRTALAAAVLSGYAAVLAVITTPHAGRTRWRCLLAGGTVPAVLVLTTLLLVGHRAGLAHGLVAASPWLLGVVVAPLLGPVLPALRLPRRWRRSR